MPYANAAKTSVMTMLRDEYRQYTTDKMKTRVGTSKFLHGKDLDKMRTYAQAKDQWADLVNHITNKSRVEWIRANCARKHQDVPWSSTPVIRVRAEDARVPRRKAQPRLLTLTRSSKRRTSAGRKTVLN